MSSKELSFSLDDVKLKGAMNAYLEECLEEFRDAIDNKDVPLQTFYCFIAIPQKSETNLEGIKKALRGFSHAAASRNVAILAGTSKQRQDGGLGLIEYREDPMDRRYKLYKLSAKGLEIRERMHSRGMKQLERIFAKELSEES